MIRHTRITLLLTLCLAVWIVLGGACPSASAAEEQWDFVHLDLDIELCPRHGNLFGQGTAKLRLIRRPSYGPTLTLSNVSRFSECSASTTEAVKVEMKPREAEVRFPQLLHVGDEVEVSFRFKSGGDSCPVVVTSECAYARCHGGWYPEPLLGSAVAPGTTRISVPDGWQTLANGRLTDSRVEGGRRIDTWTTDVAAARSFAAGPYVIRQLPDRDRTIATYLLDDDSNKATTYGEGLLQILNVLESHFGPYPYKTCSIVEIPDNAAAWKGAAENGLILMRSTEIRSEGFNLALVAHEVAHQWWGNYVGSRNPAALMVDEALAQYGIVLAIESIEGKAAAAEFLRFSRDGYLPCECAKAYFNRILGRERDKPLMELTGERYDYWLANAKGHWVYHMLRQRVGDELFFATLRGLIARHGSREMSLSDLRAAFLDAGPPEADLETFFRQWLDRSGAPVLDVTWRAEDRTGTPAARVTIRQKGEPFDLRVEVAVDAGDVSMMHTVRLSGRAQTFLLAAPGPVTGVRIDPNHRLLVWDPAYDS